VLVTCQSSVVGFFVSDWAPSVTVASVPGLTSKRAAGLGEAHGRPERLVVGRRCIEWVRGQGGVGRRREREVNRSPAAHHGSRKPVLLEWLGRACAGGQGGGGDEDVRRALRFDVECLSVRQVNGGLGEHGAGDSQVGRPRGDGVEAEAGPDIPGRHGAEVVVARLPRRAQAVSVVAIVRTAAWVMEGAPE
jgi:hypothetical protein